MNEIAKFTIGNNLRRSILSFIISKKLYDENQNKIRKVFNSLDVNHDGTIEKKELFKQYRKYFPGTPKEQWKKIELFIDTADINKNGKIEYSEFLTVMTLQSRELSEKTLREIFDFYDYSKNGYIDASDIKELFENTDITDKQIHDMLDEVDKNGDRKISFEEFVQLLDNPLLGKKEEKIKGDKSMFLNSLAVHVNIPKRNEEIKEENENEDENKEKNVNKE